MLDVYKFPKNYFAMWHLGARMCIGPFSRFLDGLDKKNILDVGAGSGWHSLYAGLRGFDVTATDISESSLEQISDVAKAMKIDHNVKTKVENCHSLSFKNNSFDAVVCSHVIEHVDEPEILLKELTRVLRPKGHLYLACPSLHHGHRLSRLMGLNLDPEDHKVLGYERKQIEEMLPKGMKIESCSYESRSVEANFLDLQGILFRNVFVANPIKKKNSTPVSSRKYFLKEFALLPMIFLCALENRLLFFIPGSSIRFIIRKDE